MAALQVLPLIEETDTQAEELFSMNDIKLEVMRARGAGGQASIFTNGLAYHPDHILSSMSTKPNPRCV